MCLKQASKLFPISYQRSCVGTGFDLFLIILLILLLSNLQILAKPEAGKKSTVSKYEYVQFDINNIACWFGNNGEIVSYNVTGNSGLEWPAGSGISAVFQAGPWLAGKVNGDIRCAVVEYRSEYLPGTVSYNPVSSPSPGIPNNPDSSRYKIYTIQPGDSPDPASSVYNPDYAEWPVADGAPAHDGEYFSDSNGNGIYDTGEDYEDYNLNGIYDAPDEQIREGQDPPLFLGDQTHWCVFNDFSPEQHSLYDSSPLGVEIQLTLFGHKQAELENVMFAKLLIINKSGDTIEDMYFGYWSDPDIGDASDDHIGCDTLLDLGYCYNANEIDEDYGITAPAAGCALLQGPIMPSQGDTAFVSGQKLADCKNLTMTSFQNPFIQSGIPENCPEDLYDIYNLLLGLSCWGENIYDPDNNITTYLFPGDPITKIGWTEYYDIRHDDRRFLMSAGPFTMDSWLDINSDGFPQPGEPGVQEITTAIIIGAGSNHLNSIAVMKDLSREVNAFYNYGVNRPKITVTEPNGGEVFSTEIPVQWQDDPAHPSATSVIIQMSTDGGYLWDSIDTLNSNPGQYSIDVSDHHDAVFGKVRVIGRIDDRQLCLASSDGTFRIDNPAVNSAPVIDPIQPFCGYKQTISGEFPVLWNIQDADDTELQVTLELKNRLEDWRPIADGLGNTAQFIWQSQYYPNSTATYLRLIASDGTNQTVTEIPYQFILSNDRKTVSPVDHIRGHSKTIVEVGIVDQSKMNQHQYEITFQEGDTVFHSVKDITGGQWIFENLPLFGPADESPVFDGIALAITYDEAINFNPSLSGWISGDCNWYVSVVTEGLRYTSYQYEIRFTDEGSVDVNGIAVPFEVWNTDLDYSPSIYVQVANDQKYNFGIYEHFGENDSAIVWVVDISAPTDNSSIPPQSGDIYLVFITAPLTNEDVYQFTNEYISDIVEDPPLPIRFSLQQNYPNPFNPTTTITYNLPKPAFTEIRIYNLAGQLVQILLNEVKPAGRHQIIWDAGDLPSGIYFYQIKVEDTAGSGVQTKKCILLK